MRGVVVIGLVAGCADPAPFYERRIFITEPRLEQIQINGNGFEMLFSQTGTKLPISLEVPNESAAPDELLFDGNCFLESMAGTAVYPAVIATGDTPDGESSGSNTIVEDGPGIVSIATTYSVEYPCEGASRTMTGTTTYTFFPTNRIVRNDVVTPTNAQLSNAMGCGNCNMAAAQAAFIHTSFWTFNVDGFTNRDGGPIADRGPGAETCAQIGSGDNIFAHRWNNVATSGPQQTRIELNNRRATVYDFFDDNPLTVAERAATSVLQISFNTPLSRESCNNAHAFMTFPPITIDGNEIALETDGPGFYVDANEHTGGTFELLADHGDIPPFGVVLDIGTATHVRVMNGQRDGQYTVQPYSKGGYLFWFDGGLPDNESIAITPY